MLGRLNQRLKGKAESGPYNDLDQESAAGAEAGFRSTSPFSQSFFGATGSGGGLGSAIELSAAGAGVVPDGQHYYFHK